MAKRPTRPAGGSNAIGQPAYEDIKPISNWAENENSHILHIDVSGYKKDHLKVTREGKSIIRVFGEHLVSGNRWKRFQENYQVPDYCNLEGARAKLEEGKLIITVPKSASHIDHEDEAKQSEKQASAAPHLPPEYVAPSIDKQEQSSPGKAPRDLTPPGPEDLPARVAARPKDEIEGATTDKPKIEKDGAGLVHEGKTEHVEPKAKQTADASASDRTGYFYLENLKKSITSLVEKDGERKLLANVGVAVLVIVALGTYIYNTIIRE